LEFCKQYETDRLRTMEIMKILLEKDLVSSQSAQYTPTSGGEPKPFAGYFGIDEQKLNTLDDEAFLDLRKRGVLPILYAQLMSLGNWRVIMQMRAERFNLTEDQLMAQAPIN
ncbi:MAG: SapC family protein, partial [Pseudomonadota bacterium]